MRLITKISSIGERKVRQKTFTIIFVLASLSSQQVLGQLSDDFSDGDFLTSPVWSGSTSNFIINGSGQLQLSNTVAATSYLSVPTSMPATDNVTWEFYIKQTFSGSASNYSRVYLVSDQQNLATALNGYYLQFGEAGSADAVELFRQTALTSVSICRSANGAISNSFGIRVKVTRTYEGVWSILVDYAGGTDFVLQTSATDNSALPGSYFGVRCTYTVSNANKFFYDDFFITTSPAPDLAPPSVTSVNVISPTALSVTFSEPLNKLIAEEEANYSVSDEVINPVSAVLQPDQQTVALLFDPPFTNGVEQILTIKNVADIAGNTISPASLDFLYFQAVPSNENDIIITEILADPSPQKSLPEVEFVEIFNRSENPFELNGWKFSDGSATATLSEMILLPNEYLILCSSAKVSEYNSHGKAMGAHGFPSLNNTGDALVLKDVNGVTIDSVNYEDSWYKDDEKKDGGWSIELIDPENVCETAENWVASEAQQGGTPGTQNSVFASKPDLAGPKLLSVFPLSKDTLLVRFDERLDRILPTLERFTIEPHLELSKVLFADAALTSFHLIYSEPLLGGVSYQLTAKDVYDCAGNILQEQFNTFSFALPEKADALDLTINEILFNPRPTGVDFVEIYNKSAKYINLKNWKLANLENEAPANARLISDHDLLIEPGAYVVFTENANVLKGEYINAKEETFIEVDLPSFPDDEGSVVLLDEKDEIIDAFVYSDKYHSVFIKDAEGVSLEKIAIESSSSESQHWKSASSTSGFATPGYLNSNFRNGTVTEEAVTIEPEIFNPVRGQPDFTQIRYNFDRGGFIANIKVFDRQGREIKQVANNQLLGSEGFFRWDGDEENGSKARIGAYMIWFEVFDADGTVKTFRKSVVIADEF